MSSKPKDMSDQNKLKEKNKNQDKKQTKETVDNKDPKEVKSGKDESKANESDRSGSESPKTSQPIESGSTSAQSLHSVADSDASVVTIESMKYLQIIDQFVSGKHWNFDIEYNMNSFSAVLWSLVITYFIFYEITGVCWDELAFLLWLSAVLSAITCIALTVVWVVWYLSLIHQYINQSKICLIVVCSLTVIASLNLLLAIIEFGSNTCYESRKLDPSFEHIVPVRYDVKTTAIIHSIVAINLFICAMLLAIKRNDFKFYVLWRKGLLNDYLLEINDE